MSRCLRFLGVIVLCGAAVAVGGPAGAQQPANPPPAAKPQPPAQPAQPAKPEVRPAETIRFLTPDYEGRLAVTRLAGFVDLPTTELGEQIRKLLGDFGQSLQRALESIADRLFELIEKPAARNREAHADQAAPGKATFRSTGQYGISGGRI